MRGWKKSWPSTGHRYVVCLATCLKTLPMRTLQKCVIYSFHFQLTVSSVKVIQQLYTPSPSSLRCLCFIILFQDAAPTEDLTNPVSLPSVQCIQDAPLFFDFISHFFTFHGFGPTDLFYLFPLPHISPFKLFLIYFPKFPSFSTNTSTVHDFSGTTQNNYETCPSPLLDSGFYLDITRSEVSEVTELKYMRDIRNYTMMENFFEKLARIYINNCPTRCNTKQSIYYSASSLYIFRVPTTPTWPSQLGHVRVR